MATAKSKARRRRLPPADIRYRRPGTVDCPECGKGALPRTLEQYGCCSKCASKAGILYYSRVQERPSNRCYTIDGEEKERLIKTHLEWIRQNPDPANRSAERGCDLYDSPIGQFYKSRIGKRLRSRYK